MEIKKEVQPPVETVIIADQETLQRSQQEDELQDMLDEKVADTLLNSDMEVETSDETDVSGEIVQHTIDAEEMQEALDTRVLRDFDEGIITFDRSGIIRYINPSASLILAWRTTRWASGTGTCSAGTTTRCWSSW